MPTSMARANRARLQRWVAAVGLLATAEEQAQLNAPETNATALLAAHAAAEAILGLIVGVVPYKQGAKGEKYFPDLVGDAAKVARPRLSTSLQSDLQLMHRTRNGFVHAGQSVGANEVDLAISAAHQLAERVSLPGNRHVIGVASVVADIIEFEIVGVWLRYADTTRRSGDLASSADSVARALTLAVSHTRPLMPAYEPRPRFRRLHRRYGFGRSEIDDLGQAFQEAEEQGKEHEAAIRALSRWVLPLALGVAPSTYDSIRSILGDPPRLAAEPGTRTAPSVADLRRATTAVSQIILRLWMAGTLAPLPQDAGTLDVFQDFIRDPEEFRAAFRRRQEEARQKAEDQRLEREKVRAEKAAEQGKR